MDTWLGDILTRLELRRTDVAEALMQPLPVIEHLDELKGIRAPRPASQEEPLFDVTAESRMLEPYLIRRKHRNWDCNNREHNRDLQHSAHSLFE